MVSAVPEQLATRVRALLRSATHPATASGTMAQWRRERDGWLDTLDPRHEPQLDPDQARRLIDFMSESAPSDASRRTPLEWADDVDRVVPELLFVSRDGSS